ncbi:MAG: type VI secretion system ATPase TssH [Opitutus sp.]
MAEIQRSTLFGKLNPVAYRSLEAATIFCKMRGNPYVELIHWIHQLMQSPENDLGRILEHFGCDASRLAADVTAVLDKLPRGATAISDFSPHLEETAERAWVYCSLLYGEAQIRTGHLVVAWVKTPGLRNVFLSISREFSKLKAEALADQLAQIVAGSAEEGLPASDGSGGAGGVAPGDASGAMAPAAMGKGEALKKFTTDLTARVRAGEIDPIIGRDEEIRQCVDILMRRRQNNPILTGEAGVGKTAVVEGFAHRIVAGDVPPSLRDVAVLSLDLGLLQAGASMKGEFEQRLRSVIDEVQASPKPIILFIDEVHTLIGAGGAAGTGDAANLLKPALARGTLRTVAATTWDEYKKHIEKDPALTRRFQTVKVDEPSEEKCIRMMRAVVSAFEKHHRVQILDEAIEAAVRLSHRYIPARQLPDKAVSLIDTSCARVGVSQHAVPAQVDDRRRRIQNWETERHILEREQAVGLEHRTRLAEIDATLNSERVKLADLEKHWSAEKQHVTRILELRAKLREAGVSPDAAAKSEVTASSVASGKSAPSTVLTPEERDKMLSELRAELVNLKNFQGESPLIFPTVDQGSIAAIVADWTGIPVGRMVRNEIEQVLKLADIMERRVIGQRSALDTIARRIQTSRARLDNPNRPIGVFMLVGPSGTGKTETALTLAEALYGGEHNLITINMSEFQEAHTVSTLKGSPPGYVGYGEGGVLTEAVRRRPYSVVLLDEVEKAHPDVHEIFFQVFDKGFMEDAEGRFIDFKNTIILLTSNAAQEVIINLCKDPELMPTSEALEKSMRGPLVKVFPDALLNRLAVIPYYPISKEILKQIIGLNLRRVERRVAENYQIPFTYEAAVPELIAQRCTELERGARLVDAMITNQLLPEISRELLTRLADGREAKRIHLSVQKGTYSYAFD